MIILLAGVAIGVLASLGALWFFLHSIETYDDYATEGKKRLLSDFGRPLSPEMAGKLRDLYKSGASVDKALDRLVPGPSREADLVEPVQRPPLTRV